MITTNKSLKLGVNFWKRLGQQLIQRVRSQAKQGIFQTPNGQSNKPKYNETYAKYKANDMRRFTTSQFYHQYSFGKVKYSQAYSFTSESRKQAKTAIQRKGNKTYGTGKRLKAYYGESISNRDVSKVNMELTGKTLRGFHVANSTEESVTMAFRPEDAGKVIGNQEKYQRNLLGLNDENIKFVGDEIINQLNKRVDAILPGNINIVIKI